MILRCSSDKRSISAIREPTPTLICAVGPSRPAAPPEPIELSVVSPVYRTLIDTWKAKANAVFTRQWCPDFDFSGGRRAHRAYFDAVKDLLAPTFTGQQLVRIPVLDRDPVRAARAITIIARAAA